MRILVVLNYYYPYVSGLSEYARLLCEEFARCGNSVIVLTGNYAHLRDEDIVNGVKVIRAPILFKISKGTVSLKFIVWAIKYARKADIVHLHLPMLEAGIIAQFIPNEKMICTYHCDINLSKGVVNKFILKVMDKSNSLALSRAKCIVVNTIEYMKTSRIAKKYIYKMKEIAPPVKELHQVERKKNEKFRIGFCGRIVEEKGINVLIEAFGLLQKERCKVELVIGGDYKTVAGGSVYPKLIEYVQRHNIQNVSFVGKIPEEKMAEFYTSLDVFTLPSINSLESFGMVQVEAMLCGTPVIASDLPGVQTVVQRTGMGLICRRGDAQDLKRCIIQIMDNYDMYVKKRSQIEQYYNIEKCVNAYLRIFNNKFRRTYMLDKVKLEIAKFLFRKNGAMTNSEVFSNVYKKNLWRKQIAAKGNKYYSGKGSDAQYAIPYAKCIRNFCRNHNISSIVDLGCGDFRVGARFADVCNQYTGIDCVEDLVDYNNQNYGNERINFLCLDITKDVLPDADLCLVRQVLQHLSNTDIKRVLERCQKYPYVIVTEHLLNHLRQAPNLDKQHGLHTRLFFGSGVYLNKRPFNLKIKKIMEIPYDGNSHLEVQLITHTDHV